MDDHAPPPPQGVIFKVLGAVLIALGTLNFMLFWRGGMAIGWYFVGYFLAGILLFMIGVIRARHVHRPPSTFEELP